MTPLAALALGCLAVGSGSDKVLAGDLVSQFPGMAAIAADTPVALAPAPGVQRVFRIFELRRLAAKWNLPSAPDTDICVERPVALLDPTRLLAAMRQSFPEAQIEILEFSRQKAPAGDLEFPRNGLRQGPTGAFWSGLVRYPGNGRFAIWARVKVTVKVERVVAVADLKPGQPISAEQLRAETRDEFPASVPYAESVDQIVGKLPRLPVPAGTAIRADRLDQPKDVLTGDSVRVDVRYGGAHLELDAQAEGSGARGQTIPVRNLVSHKRFLARIEGKGRVSVNGPASEVNP